MKDYSKKIDIIIQQALIEKTFNTEIIDKIKDLKDGYEDAKSTIKDLEEYGKKLEKEISRLNEKNKMLFSAKNKLESKIEKAIKEKRKARKLRRNLYIKILQERLESKDSSMQTVKGFMEVMFKNPVFQKSSHHSISKSIPVERSGYVSNETESSTYNKEETKSVQN